MMQLYNSGRPRHRGDRFPPSRSRRSSSGSRPYRHFSDHEDHDYDDQYSPRRPRGRHHDYDDQYSPRRAHGRPSDDLYPPAAQYLDRRDRPRDLYDPHSGWGPEDRTYIGLRDQIYDNAENMYPEAVQKAWELQSRVHEKFRHPVFNITIAYRVPGKPRSGLCARLIVKWFDDDDYDDNVERIRHGKLPVYKNAEAQQGGPARDSLTALENLANLTMSGKALVGVEKIHKKNAVQMGDGWVNKAIK